VPETEPSLPPGEVPALLRALLAGDVAVPDGIEHELDTIRSSEPTISWFGVNERRVDAIVDAGTDQYRIVYFTDDVMRLGSVSVFRRPAPLDGIRGGQMVVVNGPSGAGRSTVLGALAASSNRGWVLFDEPVMGAVDQAYLIWRDRAPQLHRGFLDAMAALARAGNRVALSAAGHPAALIDEVFSGVPTLLIGLDCDVDTLLERERGRDGRWGGLVAASLSVHDGWQYDARFDNAAVAAQDIAAWILRHTC
jgi:chloramphenicol 3-O-phosphotransferase